MRSDAPAQDTDGAPDPVGTIGLTPDQHDFAAGEPVSITVEVTNQGDAATTDGFWAVG